MSASIVSFLPMSSFSLSRSRPASSKSCDSTAAFLSLVTIANSFSISLKSGGVSILLSRNLEPASSIKSIALSGRWRSDMYLSARFAAATNA